MSCALEQAAGDAAWASLIDCVEREIAKSPTFLVYGPFEIHPPPSVDFEDGSGKVKLNRLTALRRDLDGEIVHDQAGIFLSVPVKIAHRCIQGSGHISPREMRLRRSRTDREKHR